ncbi:hypothetical protein [Gorillibacterium massiliense]|uniref:hypothetical protein n=1 Tax=Gorillibacterium massiliense TaxID=1280390 RepID=UPI00059399D2|nr:hypothetical protein [Gorillibacterium massiliense]
MNDAYHLYPDKAIRIGDSVFYKGETFVPLEKIDEDNTIVPVLILASKLNPKTIFVLLQDGTELVKYYRKDSHDPNSDKERYFARVQYLKDELRKRRTLHDRKLKGA